MSTMCLTYRSPRIGFLIILAMIGCAMMAVSHAYIVHQSQAEQAEDCFRQHGARMVFIDKTSKDHVRHNLCQSMDGTWFDYITTLSGDMKTAFQPKDGSLDAIRKWIGRKPGQWLTPDQALKLFGW